MSFRLRYAKDTLRLLRLFLVDFKGIRQQYNPNHQHYDLIGHSQLILSQFKILILEGIVEDIDKSPSNANVIVVTLKTDELKIVSAYFLPNQKKYVEHLSPGETIRFVGRVDRIERHSLCYEDCFTL